MRELSLVTCRTVRVDVTDPDAVDTLFGAAEGQLTEEVAEAVAWLMSDASPYATGATLRVAGGR